MSEERFVQVNDGRLFCSVSGKGEPLIFLHGNFNTHDIWSGQAEFFSAKYRVIRYDLRGYGRSTTPASRFSNVDDLDKVMNSMNVSRAVLIGSSSGGGIALEFALKHPERVKALVLSAPFISGQRMPVGMMWHGMKNYFAVRLKGRHAAIESFIKSDFWQYFIPSESHKAAREAVLFQLRHSDVFCRFEPRLAMPIHPPAIRRLHSIQAPTCMIIGDQDHPYNIKSTDMFHAALDSSSKVRMEGCGHLPFIEKPELFNEKVSEFLER